MTQPTTRRTDGGPAVDAHPPADEWQAPSWEDVVAQHSARVYRLAYRLTGNPHDAETRIPSRGAAPDTQVMNGLFDADVESALAELPPDFRAAVVLCDIEGLSYEEIADVLGLKLGTVRSRIHRGRTMLRKALAHRAPSAGRLRYSGPGEPRRRLAPQVG